MKLSAITILFLLLLCASNAEAQQHYIEVRAEDTIELAPIKFIYQVNVNSNGFLNFNSPFLPNPALDSALSRNLSRFQKNSATREEVLGLLKNNNFSYTTEDIGSYSISGYAAGKDSSILVTVSSASELGKLYHLLVTLPGITGSIYHIDYDSSALQTDNWPKSLYERAIASATKIARASGNTLGQLISVDEDRVSIAQIVEQITSTATDLGRENYSRKDFDKNIIKSMLFKFEMK